MRLPAWQDVLWRFITVPDTKYNGLGKKPVVSRGWERVVVNGARHQIQQIQQAITVPDTKYNGLSKKPVISMG